MGEENGVIRDEDMDINEEDIVASRLPKCKTCGRYTYGHAAPVGPKCNLKKLREEEIEAENLVIIEKRKKTVRENRNSVFEENIEGEQNVNRSETTQRSASTSSTIATEQQNLMQTMLLMMQPMLTQQSSQHQQQIEQIQQNNKSQQDVLVNLIRNMSESEGRSSRQSNNNYGHRLPVPEWNKNLSFEAWKRSIKIWRESNPLEETQKLTLILESLKKNTERVELKDWIIQEIDEDYNFDKKDENSILRLIKKMEGKFEVSKWKKT